LGRWGREGATATTALRRPVLIGATSSSGLLDVCGKGQSRPESFKDDSRSNMFIDLRSRLRVTAVSRTDGAAFFYGERYIVVIRRGKRANKEFMNADVLRKDKIESMTIAVGGFSHVLQYAERATKLYKCFCIFVCIVINMKIEIAYDQEWPFKEEYPSEYFQKVS